MTKFQVSRTEISSLYGQLGRDRPEYRFYEIFQDSWVCCISFKNWSPMLVLKTDSSKNSDFGPNFKGNQQKSCWNFLEPNRILLSINFMKKIITTSWDTLRGGSLRSRELRYVRPLRIAFSVPLNICKGIYFIRTICKGVVFDDQRCNFS